MLRSVTSKHVRSASWSAHKHHRIHRTTDDALLKQHIHRLTRADQNSMYSLSNRPLDYSLWLTMPPELILENVRGYATSLGVVAALLLSSVFQCALDPVVDHDRPALAFAFNLSLHLSTVISAAIALFSTYLVACLYSENTETIRRTVQHFGWMLIWGCATWVSVVLLVVAMSLKAWLVLATHEALTITLLNTVVWFAMQYHYFLWMADAFPMMAIYWGAFAPGTVTKGTRNRARAMGEAAASAAATQHGTTVDKILGARPAGSATRSPGEPPAPPGMYSERTSERRRAAATRIQAVVRGRRERARYRELLELRALLRKALPAASMKRIGALTQMLGLYGIGAANLRAAVGDGRETLVWHALDSVPGMQVGERLQIVTELAKGKVEGRRRRKGAAVPTSPSAPDESRV